MKLKAVFKPLLYITVCLIGILITVELSLRIIGLKIPEYPVLPYKGYFVADSKLGWKLSPGSYHTSSPTSSMTVGVDSSRICRPPHFDFSNQPELLMIGGSFVMGSGLKDNQTLAWKLQEEFPQFNIKNLGVGGYGSYQSLLVLEQQVRKTNPKCVFYGFIYHHKMRDVAHSRWLEALSFLNPRMSVTFPYATVDEDRNLIRHSPAKFKSLPFSDKLVTMFITERVINRLVAVGREQYLNKTYRASIMHMAKLVKQKNNSTKFYVLILEENPRDEADLIHFLNENNISYINCGVPVTRDNVIPNDWHFNESVQDIWAQRIKDHLIDEGLTSSFFNSNAD